MMRYRQVNHFIPGILVNTYRTIPKCSCISEQKLWIIIGCGIRILCIVFCVILIIKYRHVNHFIPGILVNTYRILHECSCIN